MISPSAASVDSIHTAGGRAPVHHAMSSDAERLPTVSPHVVYRRVDGGAVLLSMADEVYYGLSAVGARVWELLAPECSTLDELCARLRAEYPDADPTTVRRDVLDLLAELSAERLVRPWAPDQARSA